MRRFFSVGRNFGLLIRPANRPLWINSAGHSPYGSSRTYEDVDRGSVGGVAMSEADEFRRQADECFQKAETAVNEFSRAFWLGLGKQWARMVDDAAEPLPAVPISRNDDRFGKLRDVLHEALAEKALALSAARASRAVDASSTIQT